MELLWTLLLMVAVCLSEVLGSPGIDTSINISRPVHILEDHNLMVLTPEGLTQTLNETRFLMVIFREYPALAMKGDASLIDFGHRRCSIYYQTHSKTQKYCRHSQLGKGLFP